jgi:hypothetical protein
MNYILYRDGYKIQVAESYSFELPEEFSRDVEYNDPYLRVSKGICEIASGYASDGPSGPTLDTKDFIRGAVEHDAMYQLFREGVFPPTLRDVADRHLVEKCKQDGMPWFRRQYVYLGLKLGGAKAAMPDSIKPLKRAPI